MKNEKSVAGAEPRNAKDEIDDVILRKQTFSVNDDDESEEISLDECEETSNYTIVPNSLIRDATISPECRFLIMYFLSMKPGWKIKSSQLANHLKQFMGRDKILKVFKEGIEAGYIKREIVRQPGKSGGILRRYKYSVSSTPKFKKFHRYTENQDPGIQCPENQGPGDTSTKEVLREELLSSNTSLLKVPTGTEEREEIPSKKEKPKQKAESFSPEVLETSQMMIDAMRIIKEDYSAQNGKLLGILTEVDRMIRIDKRDSARIVDVFRWALCDSFWCDKMFKPNPAKYLREKFDQLEMKMRAEPQELPAAQNPKEQEKPTLTKRLKGRYTYKIQFGNYEFTSSNGYYVGKIPTNDPDALEIWLKDKGL